VREELQRLHDEGVTQEELDRAKQGLAQQRAQSRSQDAVLASSWSEKLFRGTTWAENERQDRAIAAVTREDVLKAIRTHLDPKRLSVVEVGSLP
jgi:zinc protease